MNLTFHAVTSKIYHGPRHEQKNDDEDVTGRLPTGTELHL